MTQLLVLLRAQMYYQARLDLQNHTLRIKLDTTKEEMQLIKELTIVTYKVNDKIIQIEPKEKIKDKMGGKSPNMAARKTSKGRGHI